ncbi:PREDICTED: thioredoxin domain-containing protein 3 [Chrysochloris asiatica]|uniref:Thioredoxin domain-containing protein 3 n=1 Tax=Chrysochloris asiatica TaxID=185453 RepID=A0A9B0T4T5_CHRAS|nr:PREDICTED: thioredoxin domain-containing protein 3 [Chrysochloris asiatica]
MASKKRGEVQLQTVINSQNLWDEMLLNKGLTVIDVYQAWCGPCKAMQNLFRKLKTELNEDEILHFAVAEADSVVTLQSFRDKCEPVFLFSLNGKIISMVKGANAPLVNGKIIQLINEEKKIAAGEMVRPQYTEIIFVDSDTEDAAEVQDESAEEHFNIVIIRPDTVHSRKVHEIKTIITKGGFVIEAEDKRRLTEEVVRDFYSKMADEPEFEDFVAFMTSGLSSILVISQENQQAPFEETESETQAEEPSQDYPELEEKVTSEKMKKDYSLQEYLERQQISQFCDVGNSINDNKFIDIFFPDFEKIKGMKLEKILALIRPGLFKENKEDVLGIIENEGFKILMKRQLVLSKEEAQIVCKEYENEHYFENLIENMTSGPSLALVLLGDNGLEHWKDLIGPKSVEEARTRAPESLCAQFAKESLPINQLYGSDSLEAAKKEIQYFFPPQSTLALIKPHVHDENKDDILKIIKEDGFEVTQMKELLLTRELADCIYMTIQTKDFYKDVLEMLAEGPSVIMVLTKWNAVSEWRKLMGPTDPEEARLLSPDSIRAHFGINVLYNAVHGASNIYVAEENIRLLFGELDPENLEEN